MPNESIHLYAKWIANKYTITFETNGGIAISPMTYEYESIFYTPITVKKGYLFAGWYFDSALTEPASNYNLMDIDSDITLYAKWQEDTTDFDFKLLSNISFEGIENINTDVSEYAVVPALINGDRSTQKYDGIEGITLSTSTRGSDDSSYFQINYDESEYWSDAYLSTTVSRFSNNNRGGEIRFNNNYSNISGRYPTIVFDVKMQDGTNGYASAFQIRNNNDEKALITREMLGAEENEWVRVAIISNDYGSSIYKMENGSINFADPIASLPSSYIDSISFDAYDENNNKINTAVKAETHPYGYPVISFDDIYVYCIAEGDISGDNLDGIQKEGSIKSPANLSWNGTTASWDAVEHARAYNVKLLRNGTVIKEIKETTETYYDFSNEIKDKQSYRFSVTALSDIEQYANSPEKRSSVMSLGKIQVGDYMQMGSYNGEPIMWRCIDTDENGPMFISDKILCYKSYDAPGTVTTGSHGIKDDGYSNYWGDSNLRCWLNSEESAGNVSWTCGNSPNSTVLEYDTYDNEAGFLSNFSTTEKAAIQNIARTISINTNDGAEKETFTDFVILPTDEHAEIIRDNADILGKDYIYGKLTNVSVEHSEYMKSLPSKEGLEELDPYTDYASEAGEYFKQWLIPGGGEYGGVRYVKHEILEQIFEITECDEYAGVRPVINVDTENFSLDGNGSVDEPYTVIDNVSAKISVPSETISPKIYDTVDIPVSVSENKGFASAGITINYDKDKYELKGVTPSFMLLGTTFNFSETSDGVNVLAVSPKNINGNGTLFTVHLMAKTNALNTTSQISIEPTEFFDENQKLLVVDTVNKSLTSVLSVNGNVNENDGVNSADAIMLSQYLAKYKNISLTDTQKNNADVYTDGKINIKDMYVLSQYIANHLQSKTSNISLLSEETPSIYATASYVENDSSMIDVTFSLRDNLGFTSFLFEIGFDNDILTPVSIKTEDILKEESIVSNINEQNVDLTTLSGVTALINSNKEITDSGKLYTVRFKINGELKDSDSITFTNSGFTSVVYDVALDSPKSINLKEALDSKEEVPSKEVSNLTAVPGNGQVTLSWDANDDAIMYIVYQDGVQKQTVTDTSYIIDGLENGREYEFKVVVISADGMSEGVSIKATPNDDAQVGNVNVTMTYTDGVASITSDQTLENISVIFAEYSSDNVLVSMKSETITLEQNVQKDVQNPITIQQGNSIKVMIWNNLEDIKPLYNEKIEN